MLQTDSNKRTFPTALVALAIACAILAIACIVLGVLLVRSSNSAHEAGNAGNITRHDSASPAMTSSGSWINKADDPDKAPLDAAGIQEANGPSFATAETKTNDSKNTDSTVHDNEPKQDPVQEHDAGNITYHDSVSPAMASSDFWINKVDDPDKVLLDAAGIQKVNEASFATAETKTNDLKNMDLAVNGNDLKQELVEEYIPEDTLFKNGIEMSPEEKEAYFQGMQDNILSASTTETDKGRYGIITERADMHFWPCDDLIGYGEEDCDDELISTSLNVNEPFIAMLSTADGKFCWGYNVNYTGWIETSKIAWCDDKDQWLHEWDFDITANDILVVTEPRIMLEPSLFDSSSELQLMLGTCLRLVPKEQIPLTINERNSWHNYVVYLPTRDDEGNLSHIYGLVPQTANVSIGYLPLTQRNLLDIAFRCLGARYGWGGQYGAMDCSMLTYSLYRCFGYTLPRDTDQQHALPTDNIAIPPSMSHEDRVALLNSLKPGTLLEFSGHIMIYVGSHEGTHYVLNALIGIMEETDGSWTVRQLYNTVLTPLDIRNPEPEENGGQTWIDRIRFAIRPWMLP